MDDNNICTGNAPCGRCGTHAWEIKLLLDTQESDGEGGFWWRAADGQRCKECGEPFIWYHKPAPVAIELPVAKLVEAQP